jgi:hypothetical protein
MASNVGKKEKIALLIASGWSGRSAARKFGVAERTVCRWRKLAEFNRLVDQHRRTMTDRALGKLCVGVTPAAVVLRKLTTSENEKVRLAAAKGILELQLKREEMQNVLERLAVLEEAMAKPSTPTPGINGRAFR